MRKRNKELLLEILLRDIIIGEFLISATVKLPAGECKFLPPHYCIWAIQMYKEAGFPSGANQRHTGRRNSMANPRRLQFDFEGKRQE